MNWVVLVREIIGIYTDNYMEPINVLCYDIHSSYVYSVHNFRYCRKFVGKPGVTHSSPQGGRI